MAHILRIIPYTGPFGGNLEEPGVPLNEYFGLTEYDYSPSTDPEGKLVFIESWTPNTPDQSHVDYVAEATMSGGQRISTTWRNVNETIVVRMQANTNAILRKMIRRLNEYLQRAITWNRDHIGTPIYLHFQPGTSNTIMVRSEILSGRAVLSPEFLRAEFAALQAQVTIYLTRRYYWEEFGTTSVLCVSGLTTVPANSVAIKNPPEYNWLKIVYDSSTGKNIRGDLPAPAKIKIEATNIITPPYSYISDIWCGTMWFGDTSKQTSFYAANYNSVSSGSTSGNSLLISGNTGWVNYCPQSTYGSMWPGPYRMIASFAYNVTFPSNFKVRSAQWLDTNKLWTGDWITPSITGKRSIDLGVLPIPPNRRMGGQWKWHPGFEWDSLGSSPITLEQVIFLPAWSSTKWYFIYPFGTQETLVDLEEITYVTDYHNFPTSTFTAVMREGGPIWLHPHHDIDTATPYTPYEHRMVFHFLRDDNNRNDNDIFTITISYSARYSTIPENTT